MTRKKLTKRKAPEVCPVCGEDIPRDALACPECGADYNSGWREGPDTYDAVDLPDEDFNFKTIWWITALLIIVAFIAIYFYAVH